MFKGIKKYLHENQEMITMGAAVCSDCGWPPFFVKKCVVRAGNEM